MIGEAIAHGADVFVATVIASYRPGIVMLIALFILGALFLLLRHFFNRNMNTSLPFEAEGPPLHSGGMFMYLLLLALFPLSLLFGGHLWGFPFPVYYYDQSDLFGGPSISFTNIFLNFFCWYPVLASLWVAALLESRVAGWSIAAGGALAVSVLFMPRWVDLGLGEEMPGLWTTMERGFPLDYMAEDTTGGVDAPTGYPMEFLANVVILALFMSPMSFAVERMLAQRKKPATAVHAA